LPYGTYRLQSATSQDLHRVLVASSDGLGIRPDRQAGRRPLGHHVFGDANPQFL
jgi:hypothetical protein